MLLGPSIMVHEEEGVWGREGGREGERGEGERGEGRRDEKSILCG